MPELAEVETVRRKIHERLKGKRIESVAYDRVDPYLFQFVKANAVERAMLGARILGTGRQGKYFWLKLDRKPWPIIHLGMTGNAVLIDPTLSSNRRQSAWQGVQLRSERGVEWRDRLRLSRLRLCFEGGAELVFLDPRRFGRIWLSENPEVHPRIKSLGPDPLSRDFPSAQTLYLLLRKRRAPMKSVLLDQKVFAGVGNWLADEILFGARLSPKTHASQLSLEQVRTLRKQLLGVIRKAVAVNADENRFPGNWLFHHRWGKTKGARTARGEIVFEEIGGRTTAWVPGWQK